MMTNEETTMTQIKTLKSDVLRYVPQSKKSMYCQFTRMTVQNNRKRYFFKHL